MCVSATFQLYLLMVVGTQGVATHDRYLHDTIAT